MPLAVLVPFLTWPRKVDTAWCHPGSPSSVAMTCQNSVRKSLGSLSASPSLLLDLPRKPKLFLDESVFSLSAGAGHAALFSLNMVARGSFLPVEPVDTLNRDPPGDVPLSPGELSGDGPPGDNVSRFSVGTGGFDRWLLSTLVIRQQIGFHHQWKDRDLRDTQGVGVRQAVNIIE